MKSMKTIIGTLLLTLGTIGFASCSQEEDNAVMQENENLLKIRTSIADTRNVITGTTFQDGDEIGICVTTPDGQAYTDHSLNIRATYSGGNWKLDRDVTLTDQEAIVYAYYPYDKEATDSIDINLTPGFMNRPGQTDYLQGSCLGLNVDNTTANIRFNHALARVTLAVKKSANDVGKGVISATRIENNLLSYSGQYVGERPTTTRDKIIATSGKMSIKTGERRNITSTEDYFIEVPVNCTINTSEAQNIDILLLPVSYPSVQLSTWSGYGVSVILTIDGEEYKFPLMAQPYDNKETESGGVSAPIPDGYSWEAGQQYTYPITVGRSQVHMPASIGDYYYSDGSVSSTLDSSKECVGIVFALTDSKGGKISRTLSSSMHGRIIAIDDVSAETYMWCIDSNNDVENIETYKQWGSVDIYGVPWPTLRANGAPDLWPDDGVYSDFDGPDHQQWIKTSEYPASYACLQYETAGTKKGDWYLPSFGELRLVKLQNQKGVIDLPGFSGDYWTSSEAYYSYFNQPVHRAVSIGAAGSSEGFQIKTTTYKVRAATTF